MCEGQCPSAFPEQSHNYGKHCICRCWRMIGPAKYGPPVLINSRVYGCYSQGLKDCIYIAASTAMQLQEEGGIRRHPARDHPRTGRPLVD